MLEAPSLPPSNTNSISGTALYVAAIVAMAALTVLASYLGTDAGVMLVFGTILIEMVRQLRAMNTIIAKVDHNTNSLMEGLKEDAKIAQAANVILEREKHDRKVVDAFVASTHDRIDATADAAVDEAVIETAQKADKAVDEVIETASRKADAAVDAALKKVKGEP